MLFKEIGEVFDEITTTAVMPEGMKIGPAPETIDYVAAGDAADWFVATFGYPAVSPELGSVDPASNAFRLDSIDLVYDIVYEH
eukprot:CAMPEP_0176343308 /NCGR_PEP_ID=MMETSP0126-20121128/3856_1 /TAXON_ID=141414 ORGANISM="Strombidinopsis acuminatum, Strain SPMC142" /NCGR_SAMPLE_ID=MMETSP0126 /ASSEMBLY_ACC=CAM_ASM_000229 /LENGTH=82 /DNA_ID=CAMNT_0017689211 /DNA_START=146 /DNA_END=394 /DNA_ORIENTATION=+